MRRFLIRWTLYNLVKNLGGTILFLILTVISFPFVFLMFIPIFGALGLEYWGILCFVPIWAIAYLIFARYGGMELPDREDVVREYFAYRRHRIQVMFLTPMLAHMTVLCFIKVCRFIYVPWSRYEEVVEYAVRNPRSIPLDEIGAGELKEYDRYIQPLIDIDVLRVIENDPICIKLTKRFTEFCMEAIGIDDGEDNYLV